jgi:hypothetical protein
VTSIAGLSSVLLTHKHTACGGACQLMAAVTASAICPGTGPPHVPYLTLAWRRA